LVYTLTHRTVAFDGATGAVQWTFDSGIQGQGANRGFMYWTDGTERRLFASVDQYLYALEEAAGAPVASFGRAAASICARNGRTDMGPNRHLRAHPCC
jgi:glucose dehydrogenase